MPRLPGVSWLVALASTGALRLLELRRMWQPQPPQRCHVGLSLDIAWPIQPGYRKNADHMAVLGRFSLIKRPCFVHVDCFALSIQYCHNCPTKKSHGIPLKKNMFFSHYPMKIPPKSQWFRGDMKCTHWGSHPDTCDWGLCTGCHPDKARLDYLTDCGLFLSKGAEPANIII